MYKSGSGFFKTVRILILGPDLDIPNSAFYQICGRFYFIKTYFFKAVKMVLFYSVPYKIMFFLSEILTP
jgi:hypothetical protein